MGHSEHHSENEIRDLLETYFDGGTSLEEEAVLREYFCSLDDIPPGLEYAAAMFGYFSNAAEEIPVNLSFGDDTGGEALPARVKSGPKKVLRTLLIPLVSAAAVLVIVLALNLVKHGGTDGTVYCYIDGVPVTDIETAERYSGMAIEMVSSSLARTIEGVGHPLDEAGRVLEQAMTIPLLQDIIEKL